MWCHSRSILLASRFTIQGLLQLEEIFSCCQSCREHTRGLPDSCQNLGTTLRSLGVSSGGAPSLGSEQRLYKTVHGSQTEPLQRPYSLHVAKEGITPGVQKWYQAPRPLDIILYAILCVAFLGSLL